MKKLLLIILTLGLNACAHYPDVRPSSKGNHKVSFLTEFEGEGFREGFGQAKDFCDDVYEKKAVHSKEKSEYVGSMDEESYNSYKKASKVVGSLGAAGALLGGKKERGVGAATAVGGGIADSSMGLGYRYTLYFKCR